MLWLFGEIWLWLLIAFVLGLALAASAFLAMRRHRRASADDHPTEVTPRVAQPSEPSETERTQRIHRIGPQPGPGERHSSSGHTGTGPEVDESPDEGRRQGVLPVSAAEWHVRNEWPDERDVTVVEENRPRREH